MLDKIGYRDVWNFSRHYWRKRPKTALFLVVLMITATLADTIFPIYTGKIVDALAGHTPGDEDALSEVMGYLGIYIALSVSFHTLRWLSITLWARFAVRCLYEIVTDAMHKVQRFRRIGTQIPLPAVRCAKSRAVCGHSTFTATRFSWGSCPLSSSCLP